MQLLVKAHRRIKIKDVVEDEPILKVSIEHFDNEHLEFDRGADEVRSEGKRERWGEGGRCTSIATVSQGVHPQAVSTAAAACAKAPRLSHRQPVTRVLTGGGGDQRPDGCT
eukprot:COSAG01_NODE_29689_length_632_cov_0.814259_2_plen_111_part_00